MTKFDRRVIDDEIALLKRHQCRQHTDKNINSCEKCNTDVLGAVIRKLLPVLDAAVPQGIGGRRLSCCICFHDGTGDDPHLSTCPVKAALDAGLGK